MTTPPEIPEAIVEKAARAISAHFDIEYTPGEFEPHARAALSAVAPMLRAQGMREAAEIAGNHPDTRHHILARAAEIEGGKG